MSYSFGEILGTVLATLLSLLILRLGFNWMVRFKVLNGKHEFVIRCEAILEAIFGPIFGFIRGLLPKSLNPDLIPILTILILLSLRHAVRYFFV